MNIQHVIGDIADDQSGFPLCHAVSHCGRFGKGLALQLDRQYSLKNEFLASPRQCPDVVIIRRPTRIILNLITKVHYRLIPTSQEVYDALLVLRSTLLNQNITCVVIPELSCGLDRLPLTKLFAYLSSIFAKTNISIIMYHVSAPVPRTIPVVRPAPQLGVRTERSAQPAPSYSSLPPPPPSPFRLPTHPAPRVPRRFSPVERFRLSSASARQSPPLIQSPPFSAAPLLSVPLPCPAVLSCLALSTLSGIFVMAPHLCVVNAKVRKNMCHL